MESDAKTHYPNKGKGHRHTLMMVLGCIIPLVIIGIMWVAGVSQNIIFIGLLLLCPITHLVMMRNMKHGVENIESTANEKKREELT